MAATMDTLLHDYSNDCSMEAAVPYGDGRAVWRLLCRMAAAVATAAWL